MLEKVRLIWIKGLLEPSLDQLARIELGLQTRPDAVDRPFDLLVQRPEQAPQPLPTGTPISQIFQNSGNALLILGEPGAGKTTLLLELTRDLLDRAEQDENYLIPVVFNLASWVEQRLTLAAWLMDELNKRYDVPRTLAKTWVETGLILPLLDGLDEVAADYREACIVTINAFLRDYGLLPMVVCSRVADYGALTVRLRLPSAVIIQPLSRQQVINYLEQAGESLAGLRTALQADENVWELLSTPLMLSIVALAYKGRSADEIHAADTLEEPRARVFAAYTDAMFHRRAKTTPYTREQTERWLTWLARAMKGHNQSIFYLEWMQPDWLPDQRQQRLLTFINSLLSGLTLGLVFGLGGALGGWVIGRLIDGLIGALSGGVILGLIIGLVGYSKEIKPVEKIQWSWSTVRDEWIGRLIFGFFGGVFFGLFVGVVLGLIDGQISTLRVGIIFGLIGALAGVLSSGFIVGEVGMQLIPNEGIRRSLRNASTIGLLFGLLGVLLSGVIIGPLFGRLGVLLGGVIFGSLFGLIGALIFGGRACLHHFALRLVLWHGNVAPLHYVRFLDYATVRIFLHKVGGGYVFVHRMLLEYFAATHQASAEQQSGAHQK